MASKKSKPRAASKAAAPVNAAALARLAARVTHVEKDVARLQSRALASTVPTIRQVPIAEAQLLYPRVQYDGGSEPDKPLTVSEYLLKHDMPVAPIPPKPRWYDPIARWLRCF